jgi:pimeloyl-ACP methyl ester carboxylesterase
MKPVQLFRSCLFVWLILSTLSLAAYAQTDSMHFYKAPDGTRICYEVKGTGYPVVLIHGFIVNADTWKRSPVYADLLQAGYQVITIDLRGNGRSDKPHDVTAYANDAQARDIMGIISTLHIQQYAAVGYSRGSIITARLLELDERVSKAVLGGMGTDFTNPEWPRRLQFYHALMGEDVPALQGMVQNVQRSGLDQLALAYQQKEQPATSRKVLGSLHKPVLVICGDQDSDYGSAKELAAWIPRSPFRSVPGDHNHAASSKEFSNEVLAFIR